MSDLDWRAAERAWHADPQDLAKHAAAVAARRRAGVPVSGPLLEDLLLPPQAVTSDADLHVHVITRHRELQAVGQTPGTVELPEHRAWMVWDTRAEVALAEVEAARLPGLYLPLPASSAVYARIARLVHLELLGWDYLIDPAPLRHTPPRVNRLILNGCFGGGRPDWSHSLPRLEHLTELWAKGTAVDRVTLAGLERQPSLRRLHVADPTRHLRGLLREALPHCRLASA